MSEKCGRPTRAGTPCERYPLRGKTACKLHGGASTGPKTQAGKERVAGNAVKHGLHRSAQTWRRQLSAERQAQYDELVQAIVTAEGLEGSPLDKLLVADLVRTELLLADGATWLLEHGVSVEVWRELPDGILSAETTLSTIDVPERALEAYERLVKLKARLHERLRANSGKLGDNALPPVKIWAVDASRFPDPPKETE